MTRGCQLSQKAVLALFEHKVTFFLGEGKMIWRKSH